MIRKWLYLGMKHAQIIWVDILLKIARPELKVCAITPIKDGLKVPESGLNIA